MFDTIPNFPNWDKISPALSWQEFEHKRSMEPNPKSLLSYCWAKTTESGMPGISVLDHCQNVGFVSAALLELFSESVRKLIPEGSVALAALHDVGKISPGFQQQCPEWLKRHSTWFQSKAGYEKNHALISQWFLREFSQGRLRRAAEALGAHHGFIQGAIWPADLGNKGWNEARMELLRAIERDFGSLPKQDLPNDASEWLLAGLVAVADWLASDERRFSQERQHALSIEERKTRASQAVRELLGGGRFRDDQTFSEVFADRLDGKSPNSLQQTIIEMSTPAPAIYVIEDAMGRGKTEAALWLAYRLMQRGHARGLYFGLPTRVTSDRIHRRVKKFLAKIAPGEEARLIHGHAWLRDMPIVPPTRLANLDNNKKDADEEDTPSAVRRWFASARRGLLAPFAVGTIDQALLGIVAAKWFFVRQFGLAGKVVVLDEVHSYDLYTGTLITQLVRRLRELQATPVILSATLTSRQKAQLLGIEPTDNIGPTAPYPAVTVKADDASAEILSVSSACSERLHREVQICPLLVPHFNNIDEVVRHAIGLAEQGRNVVWIRNTVHHAQEAYRRLLSARRGTDYEIGLLHSRFPAFQRASRPDLNDVDALKKNYLLEELWLWLLGKPERPRPDVRPQASILVATQVIEQSVDIDADVLISDLAPTDMLLQRIGRLHRHDRGPRGKPTLHLIVPQGLVQTMDTASAGELHTTLGAVGRVYAPYVLVRTWAEWRKRSCIRIPQEMRDILEATYADFPDEPPGWRDLRDELEMKKQRDRNLALNAADVRGRPLSEDAEGYSTRLGQKQLLLLMLYWRSPERDRAGNFMELQLLNTKKLKLEEYKNFNLDAARFLHVNTAPVPAWWVPTKLRERPPNAIAQYFTDDVVLGVWDKQSGILKLDLNHGIDADTAPKICYRHDLGLWLERAPEQEQVLDEGDAEYDDGML
jgi:CRISPR-associated endonuclease/helicase Cas3